MQRTLKSIIPLAVALSLTLGFTARAQEKKIDPSGTWKSSFTNQNGQVRESTFKLKLDAGKLTGTVSGRSADTAIEEGKVTGDEISFQVTREINGNKVTTKYTGKVSGDTIRANQNRRGMANPRLAIGLPKENLPPSKREMFGPRKPQL